MRIVERKVSAGDREIFDLDEFLSRPLYAHLAPRFGTRAEELAGLVPLGLPSPLDHRRHVLPGEPQAGAPLCHRHRGLGAGDGTESTRRAPGPSGGARVRPRRRSNNLQEVLRP